MLNLVIPYSPKKISKRLRCHLHFYTVKREFLKPIKINSVYLNKEKKNWESRQLPESEKAGSRRAQTNTTI